MQNIKQKANVSREMRVEIAADDQRVEQAQKLRFDVFSKEYDAQLGKNHLDQDSFDPHCKHLVVLDGITMEVVATTRILTSDNMPDIGHYYSETEFDIPQRLRDAGNVMEIGRTCIHPDYRSGPALNLLWMGITRYLLQNNYRYLIGCGSISIKDGGQQAWRVSQHLKRSFPAREEFTVQPKRQMPHLATQDAREVSDEEVPSLLRAYMRLGAKICGDPCWDPAFKTADLFILLDADEMTERYKRRFLRSVN